MESGGGREGICPLTAEEEALKRNTDCVYFLASPLTCKKGNECEYRHSEGARINPRDCWYWMNGNCLNPKCSFRHPPLDGLFGTSGPSSGPAKPPLQTATTVQMPTVHAPYTMNKQSVPCYYFQKGHCLKGERCPFMHAPQTSGNPVSQQVAKVSTTTELPQANKKDSGVITDCTMQQSIPSQQNVPAQQSVPKGSFDKPKGIVNKPVQVPLASVKPVTKAESAPNNVPVIKKSLPPYSVDDVLSGIQQNPFPVSSGYAVNRLRDHQVQPSDERPQNGREVDEFLGESSPGFDVLVDDDIEEPDYFHDEDNFGRASVQSGRNLNPIDEYEYHHNDYEMDTNFERDRYNGLGEYDQYGQVHDAYGREPCRASERILERPLPERRISRREANYDERDGSDLRHRLLKRRRLNGSRSAVSPDGRSEPYQRDDHSIEERDRGHHSCRNQRRIPRESSISARLRGRITLPGRSSPDVSTELQSENDRNRGRPRGRLSPPRPMNHQGRHHHERVRRRSNEEIAADARSTGGKPTRRDDTDFLDFAGPKSLAELKVAKAMENSQELSAKNTSATVPPELNNMKSAKVVRDSEDSLSFEGPKPLSVILKRKREAASGNGAISSSGDENNHRDGEVAEGGSASAALSDVQSAAPVEAKKDVSDSVSRLEEHKDETAEEEEEGLIIHGEEEGSIYNGRSSIKEDMLETDYHMEVDAMDDEDLENYDQRYGESDYEAGEGGDLKTEDDENVYQEDEDEMDDEDDFAKKVGVMFS